ncbi:LysE family transporter [Alicyclobacillus fastidiosus]|uniref:LysE family transporter n=1 Tax=Alicyclobacillus fastidiosus TaxID=392011 RepID=A0ABY6ZAQ5_9BACL|nr:LysE family transporter [Alicyclobacillus fastidiosus]WAH39975.1 LysE family transporter [Alicyclobacillus fastidiosus]GMA61261.1 amino acid transporter LysE [Alicyclobacillus fastidiosus]
MHIVPFLTYVFVTTFTPGPNNIMSMSSASRHGFSNTLKFTLGVAAGFFVILLLSCYFNLLLFHFVPKIDLITSILGAIYMLYLAFKVVKSTRATEHSHDQTSNSFASGLVLQFINPKVIVYGLTVISTFIIPLYKSTLMFILFSLFLALVGFLATSCWAAFGAGFQRFLATYRSLFNLVMALMLTYSAISIFI